jgi:hypothetical protein
MTGGDDQPIYDDLMRFKPDGMTPNAWAMKAGVSRTVWADMRRHGNPSRRTLGKLLAAAGSSLAEFEALRVSGGTAGGAASGAGVADRQLAWGAPGLSPLSLLATAIAGELGNPSARIDVTELDTGALVDRIPRPVSLANDHGAYAITIVGDSMWPRFRPGRRVAVSPKAPAAIGDDVLVKLRNGGSGKRIRVLIKELVRRSGSGVELRQFNPDTTFHVPSADIAGIEKVVGELV